MARPKRTEALSQAIKDAEAAQLRAEGKTFRQIAELQGVAISTAAERVGRAIAAVPVEAVDQLRRVELERLDEMFQVAWRQLHLDHVKVDHGKIVRDETGAPIIDHAGKLAGLDRLLRIQERRSRLLGLDAPTQVRHEVMTEDVIDAEIRRLERELEANAAEGYRPGAAGEAPAPRRTSATR